MEEKRYLGDGVYVTTDADMIVLTTEDGGPTPTNTIYLEPSVFAALVKYGQEVLR